MQGFGDGINGGLGHLQDAIPEKLLGKQLGELNARRQKELLKKPGTVVVLGSKNLGQVAYVDVVKQGEFAPLCAFVSHFWGEETLSFAKSLRLHGEKVHPANPGDMCYYICSFSNCQHAVDLGADWEVSPFNRALEYVANCRHVKEDSVYCAVMLFDESCSTLERIWCIFEIWRCCKLELRLDLFTAEGQLTRRSSTPLACKIREQAKVLDFSNTKCSEKSDKLMIEKAVKTSGTTWAQIAGVIQLQITSLVEFSASLAISRNALTGEVLSAEDVEMQMSETSEVRNSSSIIRDCMQGQLQRILVVGQGGTGKSVFAREVVRRVAQAQEEGGVQEAVIPLRVPLAELADIKEEGVDLLQAWAKRAFGSDSDEILRDDRRLVLVLDGLDEAAIARRRALASDGSAREPAASVVLGQFSETSLLTQEPLPVSSHVRLHDGTGQSLGAGTVLSCDKAFLLQKEEENGPEPGVHSLKVRRKGPETVFSAAVSVDYADRSGAQVILERALRHAGGDPAKFHRVAPGRRRSLGAGPSEGGPLPALGAVGALSCDFCQDSKTIHRNGGSTVIIPINYDEMLEWPRGAFPCRAILDRRAPDDRKVEDVEVSFRETSAGIFLEGDLEPGDEVELGSDGPQRELLPLDRCFRVVLDGEVPRCPASLGEMTVQDELSLLGFAPLEILPLSPPLASRISKFGEEELRALPEAVWRTPLMASILGPAPVQLRRVLSQRAGRGEEEDPHGATAELVLMEHAVETLLKQAEERTGFKELRAELGPLCLAKLQAGQRLLWESDFTSQVVFQEEQLGHLRFFEPAGQAVGQTVLGDSSGQKFEVAHTLCQVQLYHLRMQEFLAAEAPHGVPVSAIAIAILGRPCDCASDYTWIEPRLAGPVGGCPDAGLERSLRRSAAAADAARPAHPQSHFCKICVVTVTEDTRTETETPWLQLRSPTGALRFCLMMQTAHAAEAEIDLKGTKLVAADAEAFQGALLCTEKLALNLDDNHLGEGGVKPDQPAECPEGASSLSSALPKRLRQLQLDLIRNSIGRGSQRGFWDGQEGVEGARALAAALAELPLQELQLDLRVSELGLCNGHSEWRMDTLWEKLGAISICLESLHNGVSDGHSGKSSVQSGLARGVEGARALAAALAQLPLQGDEGAQALAAAVAKLPLRKLELNLRDNSLGPGAQVICDGQVFATPGVEAARALAAALAQLPLQELQLELGPNELGDEGARTLAAALAELPLQELRLDLRGNRIGDDGARAVAAAVGQLPQLQKLVLDLCDNSLSGEVKAELRGQQEALPIPEKHIFT
ncbi:Nlrc5 [Symbiodinium microadriaticum]|nr:Nlrc5 [Symbiodinium microadriaticum]